MLGTDQPGSGTDAVLKRDSNRSRLTGGYDLSVARRPEAPADSAVVVVNRDDDVTAESFAAWLDRRQAGEAG